MRELPFGVALRRLAHIVLGFVTPILAADIGQVRPKSQTAEHRRIFVDEITGHGPARAPTAFDIGAVLRITHLLRMTVVTSFADITIAPLAGVDYRIDIVVFL